MQTAACFHEGSDFKPGACDLNLNVVFKCSIEPRCNFISMILLRYQNIPQLLALIILKKSTVLFLFCRLEPEVSAALGLGSLLISRSPPNG